MSVITVKSVSTGKSYQYDDGKHAGSGGMKDVYFSPDRSYVVQIFKAKQDANALGSLARGLGRRHPRHFARHRVTLRVVRQR